MKIFEDAEFELIMLDSTVDVITTSNTGLKTETGDDGTIEFPWDFDSYGL